MPQNKNYYMRIGGYQFPVFKPYGKATLEIYFQGCLRTACSGKCHNPELRVMSGGEKKTIEDILDYIETRISLIESVSFTGGDPLYQDIEKLYLLAITLKERWPQKELWLFTGEDDITKIPKQCFECFDIIKYGSYQESLKQDGFPSSTNQKIWKKQ